MCINTGCTEQAGSLRETSDSNINSRLFCLNWDFSCQTIYQLKNSRHSLNSNLLIIIKLCWRAVFPCPEQQKLEACSWNSSYFATREDFGQNYTSHPWKPRQVWAWQALSLPWAPAQLAVGVSFLTPLAKCFIVLQPQTISQLCTVCPSKGCPCDWLLLHQLPKILITGINSVCWELPKVMGELFGACLCCTIQ